MELTNGGSQQDDIMSITTSDIRPTNVIDIKCAPSKKFENGSCIPLFLLVEMAEAYNKENGQSPQIKLDSTLETLNPVKYKRYLIKQFKKHLSKVCDDQSCWIRQTFIDRLEKRYREELSTNTFRTKGPQGKFEWLNTNHINDSIRQYENKHDDFKFLGAVPIDFDDLPRLGIKNINYNNFLEQNKKRLGIIFNTDESYKTGEHWVSMFIDLDKGFVYYSDSYGTEPEDRIRKFMRKTARFIRDKLNKQPVVKHNKTKHQRGNNACGVYSINFILRLLRGESFEDITRNRMSDSKVNMCREFYFK